MQALFSSGYVVLYTPVNYWLSGMRLCTLKKMPVHLVQALIASIACGKD